MKKITLLCTAALIMTVPSCTSLQNYTDLDRGSGQNAQDYRDAFAPRDIDLSFESDTGDAGVPPLESYIVDDVSGYQTYPLVTITMNQNIPLRDALYELARQADYDIELDPRITGSIIFSARNKPLDDVLERISRLGGLRHSLDDGVFSVELDTPYAKTYRINYIGSTRASTSNINNDISVVSGEGANAGSNFTITSEYESNFWDELSENLDQLMVSYGNGNLLRTDSDPVVVLPAPVIPPLSGNATEEILDSGGLPEPNIQQIENAGTEVPNTPQIVDLPVNNTSATSSNVNFTPSYSINRQAGLISVFATDQLHDKVREYVDEIERHTSSQVLIEAKVLQVELNEQFAVGIDWNNIDLWGDNFAFGIDNGARTLVATNPSAPLGVSATIDSGEIGAAVTAISQFGTVRALASPRITVINNQPAVLNVATNRVFFELDIEVTQGNDNTPPRTDINSEIRNIPEGVLINVLPNVDLNKGIVTLQVRPTITRVDQEIDDPSVAFAIAAVAGDDDFELPEGGISSRIPEVSVQEVESILRMKDGEVAILGGLMEDRSTSQQNGVPILSEIPLLGAAFRNQGDQITKTELVIFLKATIIDNHYIDPADKDFYKLYSGDRRPFNLNNSQKRSSK